MCVRMSSDIVVQESDSSYTCDFFFIALCNIAKRIPQVVPSFNIKLFPQSVDPEDI